MTEPLGPASPIVPRLPADHAATPIVSLGEGFTRCSTSGVCGGSGLSRLDAKVEGANPTGSFKVAAWSSRSARRSRRRPGHRLCVDRQTSASAAAIGRPRPARGRRRPAGRQGRPGQLVQALWPALGWCRSRATSRRPPGGPGAGRTVMSTRSPSSTRLKNPPSTRGPEDAAMEVCDDLGRRPGHPCHPRRERRQHQRLLARSDMPRPVSSSIGRGCGASRPTVRRRSSLATGWAKPETVRHRRMRIGQILFVDDCGRGP